LRLYYNRDLRGLCASGAGNGPTADDQCFGGGGLRRGTAWVLPDAESPDLNRENVECQFEASKLTASAGLEGVDAERKRAELEALRMEAKGCDFVSHIRDHFW
jgi:hypothetical protein